MAKYIDKEQLLDFLQIIPIDLGYREIEDVEQFVKNMPAADVVEVVRCKDCVYGEVDDTDFPFQYLCRYYGDDWNDEDHYCSHGTTIKR